VHKVSTSSKILLALSWAIRCDKLSGHWVDTNTTGSYCFKNHQTCSKSLHVYIICSLCLPLARTLARRRWRHVADRTINKQRDSDCSLVLDASFQFVDTLDIRDLGTRWRRTFWAYTADDVTCYTFEHFWDNHCIYSYTHRGIKSGELKKQFVCIFIHVCWISTKIWLFNFSR